MIGWEIYKRRKLLHNVSPSIGLKFNINVARKEKGAFRKNIKKNKSSNIILFVSSVYCPNKIEDQEIFNEYLSSIYSQIPTKSLLLSGQDMNTNLGVRSLKNDSIGSYGLFKKNKKGVKAVNILRLHKLFATTTFFEHRDKVTWKIFDGKNTFFQLDH